MDRLVEETDGPTNAEELSYMRIQKGLTYCAASRGLKTAFFVQENGIFIANELFARIITANVFTHHDTLQ